GRHQLPVDRPKLILQLQHATAQEALDSRSGLREGATMSRIARRLQGEDKPIGCLVPPFCKRRRLLRAVKSAIDLDRGKLTGSVFQLTLLWQGVRIESTTPRLVGPAANADSDLSAHIRILHPRAPRRHPNVASGAQLVHKRALICPREGFVV